MSHSLESIPEQTGLQAYEGAMVRSPESVLAEAKIAAQALRDVIAQKSKPVTFNGEQYLEFEDWMTMARFYGITVKVVDSKPIDFGDVRGFEARAVAIQISTGQEISSADAMCLSDEKNWSNKPLFQLRSMAQTRACSKALRNVLAWVAVLGGYRPTPAEEMDGVDTARQQSSLNPPTRKSESQSNDIISEGQRKRFYAIYKGAGLTDEEVKKYLYDEYRIDSGTKIKKVDYEAIVSWAQSHNQEPGGYE